jgi:hypothetical protein
MTSFRLLFQLLLLITATAGFAQKKIIRLDARLSENSTPMEARPKGISTVSKYQFGDYAIVSGKAGWTTTNTRSRLFSFTSDSKSKQKLSFVFVGDKKDSVIVNASVDADFKELNIGNYSELRNSQENFVAFLSPASGTLAWQLVLATMAGSEVAGNFQFRGSLTDGQREIEVRAVREWSDGKTPNFAVIPGYEFYLDGESIAAVQGSVNTAHKKYVWLRSDLPEDLKLIVACSAAAVFVMIDGQMSRM